MTEADTIPSLPALTGGGFRRKHPIQLLRSGWQLLQSAWQARKCTNTGGFLRIDGRLIVNNYGAIHLGERVRIRASHVPVELGALPEGTLVVGNRCFINSGVSICAAEKITIGDNVAIGNYSLIMDTDFHNVNDHTLPGETRPVTIEDNVWIGARATVLKGVTIGRGAVVAAGAVVTRDVAPFTLVGGVPAKPIRTLPSRQ